MGRVSSKDKLFTCKQQQPMPKPIQSPYTHGTSSAAPPTPPATAAVVEGPVVAVAAAAAAAAVVVWSRAVSKAGSEEAADASLAKRRL